MDIHFVAPDLRALDKLRCEAISLPLFEDERPARGALGAVDWRLCGRVSELMRKGLVTGEREETVLLPARAKLAFEKLFIFGMGKRADFDEAVAVETARRMLDTLSAARVRASAFGLPGRHVGAIEGPLAMEAFLTVAQDYSELDEVTLIEPLDAQKAMEPIVERDRRRRRALG